MRTAHQPEIESVELAEVLQALSDPVRLEIVRCLAVDGERCCGDLNVPVSKSTLSHHLKVLRQAGLTQTRADGTQRLVSLRKIEVETRFPRLLDAVLAGTRSVTP
jgi:DNA-binding transcriptional ArsR family regulator